MGMNLGIGTDLLACRLQEIRTDIFACLVELILMALVNQHPSHNHHLHNSVSNAKDQHNGCNSPTMMINVGEKESGGE